MGIDFVTKVRNGAGNGDVTITLRGTGEKRKPYTMGIILSQKGREILGNPDFLTAAVVKEKDHIRCYFKVTDKCDGFHGDIKNNKQSFTIPRIKKEDIQEMIGSYKLKFSKTYGFYYVEKEILNFVERTKKR